LFAICVLFTPNAGFYCYGELFEARAIGSCVCL